MSYSRANKVDSDLYDIINGFSALENAQGRDFFFKHISTKESLRSDKEYRDALKAAINRGIKSRRQLLDDAIKYGKWSEQDDEFVKATEWEIKSLDKVRKKTSDPTQKSQIGARMDEKRQLIIDKQKIKNDLCNLSAEQLAERTRLEYLVEHNCFLDEDCQKQYKILEEDTGIIQECLQRLNDKDHIIRVAYSTSFFDLFMIYKKQPHLIFGDSLPAVNMTIYQKNLIIFAGILLSKLEYGGEKLTDEIRQNPIALFNFDPDDKKPETTDGLQDLKDEMKKSGEISPEKWLS